MTGATSGTGTAFTNNALQNTTQKTNDRATRTPLNTEVNSGATEAVPSLLVAFLVLLLYDTNTKVSLPNFVNLASFLLVQIIEKYFGTRKAKGIYRKTKIG
jgi:hypothetical protein